MFGRLHIDPDPNWTRAKFSRFANIQTGVYGNQTNDKFR